MGILASFKQPATFMNSDVIKTVISVDWMKKLTYRDETVKIMKGLLIQGRAHQGFSSISLSSFVALFSSQHSESSPSISPISLVSSCHTNHLCPPSLHTWISSEVFLFSSCPAASYSTPFAQYIRYPSCADVQSTHLSFVSSALSSSCSTWAAHFYSCPFWPLPVNKSWSL